MNLIIEELIYPVLDEIKETLEDPGRLIKAPDTPLFGSNAVLDSLGLVNLIVVLEERIEDHYGVSVTLANEKAMSRTSSPFRSVSTLAEYINELIREEQNGA
jgi:acyl carrier protein